MDTFAGEANLSKCIFAFALSNGVHSKRKDSCTSEQTPLLNRHKNWTTNSQKSTPTKKKKGAEGRGGGQKNVTCTFIYLNPCPAEP